MLAILRFWLKHQDVWINTIDRTVGALLQKKRPRLLCQVGNGVIGITVDGDLYPCHDFSGQYAKEAKESELLKIGHISTGFTSNRDLFSNMSIDPEVKSGCGYDCSTCWAKWTCARGCPYMNYASTGNMRIVNPTYCAMQRADTLMVLKWMGTSDQINFSYCFKARGRRAENKAKQIVPEVLVNNDFESAQSSPKLSAALSMN